MILLPRKELQRVRDSLSARLEVERKELEFHKTRSHVMYYEVHETVNAIKAIDKLLECKAFDSEAVGD